MDARRGVWERLVQSWRQLRDINLETDCDATTKAHCELLDELAAAGELDAAVADPIQRAFSEAVDHRQRLLALCYAVMPVASIVRQDLLEQAEMLEQVGADLDPAVVDKVRAAIARDIAFLLIAPQRMAPFVRAVPAFCQPCPMRDTCQGGCKAAAEVCYGSLEAEEPFLRCNRGYARPAAESSY